MSLAAFGREENFGLFPICFESKIPTNERPQTLWQLYVYRRQITTSGFGD